MSDTDQMGTVKPGEHTPSEKGADATQSLLLEARSLGYAIPLKLRMLSTNSEGA